MRAVNLIPSDQRSGGSVGAGRSEGAAYAVLAVLVGIALLAFLYGKAHRDISSHRSEAAAISAKAARAQAEAGTLAPFTSFVQLREQRAQAVATLVDSRFDWAHAFHELGRVLTGNTSLSSLDASIASGAVTATPAPAAAPATPTPTAAATPAGAATAAAGVSSATPPGSVPTFNLSGCATSQSSVAQMLQRLRLIDGVAEVNLQSSTSAGTTGAAGSGTCGSGPAFTVTVAFDALPSAAASAAAAKAGAKTVSLPSSPTTGSGGTPR
jgi:Tfp pilus assembly protein PilN